MSQEKKNIRIQSRIDSKANWEEKNPTLLDREIGYEKETGRYKFGAINEMGEEMPWNDLPYASVGNKGATTEQINDLIPIINDKVDKISGKTLSSNDFTNDYKAKIDNTEHLIDEKIATLIDSSPKTLDTLNKLAKALGYDPNFATTILNQLSQKVDIHLVEEKIAALIDSAPETLDTLNELAKALGNDPNFATTILNQLSQKADITYVNNLFNSIINGEEVYY